MLNKNVKGYIFDYGGTLDTAGCHWGKFLWHAYQRQEVPVKEQDFRDAYVYTERFLGNNTIIQPTFTFRKTLEVKIRIEMEQLCTSGAWLADEESFKLKHQAVLNDVYGEVQKITSHSKTVLHKLHEHYPMILVSNFYVNINEVLKEFALDDMFEYVIESAVVKVRKPNPRIFAMGAEALAMKANETIVVGDSFYKDIEPAHKLGCYTAWFKGEGWDNKVYDESLPDMIINDLAQLL